jgi:hypothetical protein
LIDRNALPTVRKAIRKALVINEDDSIDLVILASTVALFDRSRLAAVTLERLDAASPRGPDWALRRAEKAHFRASATAEAGRFLAACADSTEDLLATVVPNGQHKRLTGTAELVAALVRLMYPVVRYSKLALPSDAAHLVAMARAHAFMSGRDVAEPDVRFATDLAFTSAIESSYLPILRYGLHPARLLQPWTLRELNVHRRKRENHGAIALRFLVGRGVFVTPKGFKGSPTGKGGPGLKGQHSGGGYRYSAAQALEPLARTAALT